MRTTVLVVDDHPGFRAVARRLLEAAGMEVVGEAGGAVAAVAAALAMRPDLVLLDVRLPDGDGFEVARCLQDAHVDATTVLISSREEAAYPGLAAAAGAAGFVPKSELTVARLWDLLEAGRRL